jgi:hypothetical protein
VEKSSPKIWATFVIVKTLHKVGRTFAQSGVDVMITNFCDFCKFSAKKIGVFSQKPMLSSQFLQKLEVLRAKNANIFAKFFGENIFKIIASVPGHPASMP